MNVITSYYQCSACAYDWAVDWDGDDTSTGDIADECPECGHKPVQPYEWEEEVNG